MYTAITQQQQGVNYKGSVKHLVDYLEKENEKATPENREYFFDQDYDDIAPEEVIAAIDNNTARLSKKDPKFYSIVINPSQRELRHIANNPERLKAFTREVMKAYAASFNRDRKVTIDDILYYAKLEHKRYYSETDRKIKENQPYATKILQHKHQIRKIESGKITGNINRLQKEIAKLERKAPHKLNGKRITHGMQKEGPQSHIHIIVSRTDRSNTFSLSPGSKYRKNTTILNGKETKQGFDREKFYKGVEAVFDRKFGYKRNFVESYWGRKLFLKNPKRFFMVMAGLPTTQRQTAYKLLQTAGVHIPTIPLNKAQLAYKTFMKLKKGVEVVIKSGSIGV